MFTSFNGPTANKAWLDAAGALEGETPEIVPSRCGDTVEILNATLSIEDPRQRWVVARDPAINPALAIAEVIWILQGRNDSWFLTYFCRNLPKFAGHGKTFDGAYGERLRAAFKVDQIERAFRALESNPDSRQVLLQIWNPSTDLPPSDGTPQSHDIPCNITSLFKIRDGLLHWTQIMRSNDLYRGLPHNLIQFTTLQEVFAGWLNLEPGPYHHLSHSLHAYQDDINKMSSNADVQEQRNIDSLADSFEATHRHLAEMERFIDLATDSRSSVRQLKSHLSALDIPPGWLHLVRVVACEAFRRRKDIDEALSCLEDCRNPMLRQVADRWLQRLT